MGPCTVTMLITFGRFCTVCMAGHTFGKILSPLGMPSITLFIFFGLLSGPVGFDLVPKEDSDLLAWISDMALGFIGLSAGGHFHVSEMAGALAPALTVLCSLVIVTFSGCLITMLWLGSVFIPFFGPLETASRYSAALLIACLSVARSPSSAIAIISELNAKGPFTTVVLAVTVMMDVVVVILFSITLLVATALENPKNMVQTHSYDDGWFSGPVARIARMVLIEFSTKVLLSAALGVVIGHAMPLVLGWTPPTHAWPPARNASIFALGCAVIGLGVRALVVFLQRASLPLAGWLLFFEEEMSQELNLSDWLNPLICTMVAGFTIVNYTQAGKPFHEACDSLSGPIYLLFFLYTGVAMEVEVLQRNLPAAGLIFATRAILIIISTYIGGVCANQPREFSQRYWMAFLTQAGVTLGLAQQASAHFAWGPDFNATIVAVSVINQVVGPPMMKYALRAAGEAHHNYVPNKLREISGVGSIGAIGKANLPLTGRPQPRGALVIAQDSLEPELYEASDASVIVDRLRSRGWEVMVADQKLGVAAAGQDEKRRLNQKATTLIDRLPAEVRDELVDFQGVAKPWERIQPTRSLPDIRAELRRQEGSTGSNDSLASAPPGTLSPDSRRMSPAYGTPIGTPIARFAGSPRARDVRDLPFEVFHSGEALHSQAEAAMSTACAASLAQAGGIAAPPGVIAPPPPVQTGSPTAAASGRVTPPAGARRRSSAPTLPPLAPKTVSRVGVRRRRYSAESGYGAARSTSFGGLGERRRNLAEMLGPPTVPSMPEDPIEDPVRYAQCIRLLWLAASMKSFDVVVCMLDSDEANVAMCELIGAMVPMLQFTRKRDPSPPQVVVALSAAASADAHLEFFHVQPAPLIIPRRSAMASLVCEVLHPMAHWTASLESDEPVRKPGSERGTTSPSDGGGSGGGGGGKGSPAGSSPDKHSPTKSALKGTLSAVRRRASEAFLAPRFTSPLASPRRTRAASSSFTGPPDPLAML